VAANDYYFCGSAARQVRARVSQVLQLHAADCDEGLNAEIQYAVDKRSYFAVNATTGMVSVWRRLDTSLTTNHVLRVTGDGQHIGGTRYPFSAPSA